RDGLQRLAGMPVVSKAKPVEVPRKPLEDAAIERTWNAFLDNASNYGTATLRIDDARTGQVDINWLPADAPHDRAFNRLTLDAATGAVLRNESFAAKPPMQRLLAGMLPLHNGRYFGPIGVVLVLIGALMLPVFAATGWWLYLDRRRRVQPQRK
ncbi:PepSY-associated TM helix domain-containing protein, partial [Escherichia coli]|uniref:PepSY-associated TM helix domain-containing protein n=4 Tax=Pseudomonadota TaxID=1224 RepID=UPI0019232078